MISRFPHLAQRLFNRPVAIHPDKAEVIIAALADRLGVAHLFNPAHGLRPAAEVIIAADNNLGMLEAGNSPRAGYCNMGGVAVIEVEGTLVQKTGCLTPYSGLTGYDGIRANLTLALDDPAVRAIALDIDSPGGEVAGCFDLADYIRQCAAEKPVHAILDEMACSAAYALASACSRITIPRTGIAGSIGVIAMHADFSRALDKQGVTVTVIKHGARKADGNPYQPLEGAPLGRIQADIDTLGAMFSDTVARYRNTTPAAIEAMEAGTFLGAEAVAAGLADAVMAPDAALRALLASL
jgi:signal peptide peptidase SppA